MTDGQQKDLELIKSVLSRAISDLGSGVLFVGRRVLELVDVVRRIDTRLSMLERQLADLKDPKRKFE